MEGSQFVTDAELVGYINGSAQELYDVLVSSFQDYYISQSADFVLTSGVDSITLPANFYKLRGVDKQLSATDWQSISPFSFAERNDRAGLSQYSIRDSGIRYRVQGAAIKLTPATTCEGTYRFWYVPRMTLLALDADNFDGINGWDEYVIVDAAIKCLQKEESSTSTLEGQKKALLKRIEDMSKEVDVGSPEVIVPVVLGDWWMR